MADGLPTPTERLEQLTSLYERHAYVVWNVALRTAMDRERAMEAARRAFIGQVAAPDEARLAPEAGRFAAEASQPVDTRSVEDPVLAATARLAAVQRAVLALDALSGGEHAGAFGLDAPTEQDVRRRASEQLAMLLSLQPADAEEAYADLPWEEPPEELWQQLYPELHAAVTRHARSRSPEAATEVLPGTRRWSAPRIPRAALVPVAVFALAGVAWAASGGGSGSAPEPAGTSAGQPGSPAPASGASGGSAYSAGSDRTGPSGDSAPALSAEELDRLRQEEIEDLKRFTARKADRSLPPRARRRAARKVDDLVELAQARQRAAERRELALRRALARERAARMREENRREEREDQEEEPAPEPARPAPRRDEPSAQPPESRDKPDGDAPSDDEAQAECLYDEGSGAYICPE